LSQISDMYIQNCTEWICTGTYLVYWLSNNKHMTLLWR